MTSLSNSDHSPTTSADLCTLVSAPVGGDSPRVLIDRPRQGHWFQWQEPFDFEWNRVRLEVPGLPSALKGLRFIHLTDLHLRNTWHPAYDRLLQHIRQADADLLLFTGDMVDNKVNYRPAMPIVRRIAPGLTARLGAYAILGNHDRLHFAPEYQSLPLQLISGRRVEISHRGATIELIGLPGATRKQFPPTFPSRMPARAPDSLRVVLSHYPDHWWLTRSLQPDVYLAGHTHGGQVCLPGGVPIIKHDSSPRRYCTGLHRIESTWFLVGRGFGYTTLPIRIFCPPEVTEVVLE